MNDAYWDKNYKKITKKTIGFRGFNDLKGTAGEKAIEIVEYFEPINSENSGKKAVEWIEKEILPKAPKEGELQAEGLADGVAVILTDQLKQQAITWAGEALEYLKEKGIEWAINLAGFTLEKLQNYLFEKYRVSNDEQKEVFKKKILEKFPDSGLADKLRKEANV